ncbi:MAG: winged helix-turn-helix domain-containing protein, partial [Pyrinomonadaceae bacterium]
MMSSDLTSDLLQFNFTMPKGSKNGMYSFDRFKLDSEKLMLYRDETEITLAPKIVKTLAVLIENRGSILSKDELIEKVWDDSIVEESNLSQNLYILRKTLGTKPDGGQYIETLRRRGYRFNAEVSSQSKNNTVVQNDALLSRVALIGREKELDHVIALLARDEVRLVTVSGVGGVGKTTLARAVAKKLKGERDVFFVELAAVRRPELVVSAIAATLGVKESGDESAIDRINESLEGRSTLLVLDNFEQVVSAAPLLVELTNSDNYGLKILITSRVTLRVKAETLYVLPPLQVPAVNGNTAAVSELSNCEAVSLFVERAKQAQPEFELMPANAADVASICTQLGGLPLAIEIAGARMRFMSPEAVLRRLRKQLDFLQGAKRDAPQRQQTMRETIAWSYDLLTHREKRMFARFGVFLGGFDLEAAEYICSDLSGGSSTSILDDITSLVEHNLLAARNSRNGEPRIYMLEVVREFAEEVLTEQNEIETTRAAHAEYFLHLGEEAEPQLLAARSAAWLDRLETEHDNLRAAFAWSTEHDPSIGQRLAGAIWRFWWLHGHIREACDELGVFLSMSDADPKARAKMLVGATFLNRLAGNSDRSRMFAEEGVKLASSSGDLRTAALSLNQLGFLALDVGDFSTAERMFGRGLTRAEALGDIQILALLNNGLGELSRSKGEFKQAAEFYGRALKYNRDAGDRVRQTTCLINLGATALMQDDRESAGAFYRNGLEISSEMEDMNGSLYCLEGMAGSYWALHDPERACLIFGAAHMGRQKNNLLLEPADQVPYEESVALVREALGKDSFTAKFSKGSEMGLDSAISLALDKAISPQQPTPTSTSVNAESRVHGEHIVVERQGNVLRLVNLSPPEKINGLVPATVAAAVAKRPTISWYPISMVLVLTVAAIGMGLFSYFG